MSQKSKLNNRKFCYPDLDYMAGTAAILMCRLRARRRREKHGLDPRPGDREIPPVTPELLRRCRILCARSVIRRTCSFC